MKVITGSDWSVALNQSSASVLSDSRLLQRIGRELRSVYEEVVEEPVPDQLAALLQRLEERDDAASD